MSNEGCPIVEQPLVANDKELNEMAWEAEAELLIVGFGAAGTCAALQAREAGASVIVVDRFDGGGATAYSGGVVYGGDTQFQRQGGVKDSADEMFNYLTLEVDAVRPETLRRYCEGSAGDIAWLASKGVPFGSVPYWDKCGLPPEGKHIYFSGNENLPGFKERAAPAPRGHRTVGPGGWTGNVFYAALRAAALAAGIVYRPHNRAMRLVMDRHGVVAGVEVSEIHADKALRSAHLDLYRMVKPMKPFSNNKSETAINECREFEALHGKRKLIRAKRAVILATGGFVYNLPLLVSSAPHLSRFVMKLLRAGSMGCDGSGIELGKSIGAATGFMDNPTVARVITPPPALQKGIIVNRFGERFVNELSYSSTLGKAISQQPDGEAWLLVDRKTFREAIKEAVFLGPRALCLPVLMNMIFGGTRRARTLERLAEKLGIDPNVLSRTVGEYNCSIAEGKPDRFLKTTHAEDKLDRGPFRAINVSMDNGLAFSLTLTLGGLRVDEDTGQVVREDGSRVGHLFAAGRVAVGLCSSIYISGMSLGDAVFSARRAARAAIADQKNVDRASLTYEAPLRASRAS